MKKLILLANLCILTLTANGQSLQLPKNIQSPNASSIGRFGELPINYYTGKVNVNIPIFSINENEIPFDLSFHYDTGGVRVNDLPNWIGQNWNMNAGGIIIRTEKGTTVDELIYHSSIPYTNKGYYYNTSTLNTSSWSDTNNLKNIALSQTLKNDLEPDIFSFNFMGFSGKFFLDSDGSWKVQSDDNLKVEINIADNVRVLNRNTLHPWYNDINVSPKCFGKITITDEGGNKYVFGGTQNAIEYGQHDFYDYERGVIANAWYLTSVIDRYGNTVYSFEYERGDLQAHFYLSYYSKTREKSNNGSFWQPGGGCLYSEVSPFRTNGNLIIPSYLKKITTKNGYVINFIRSYSTHKGFSLSDNSTLNHTFSQWITNHSNLPPYYLPYTDYAKIKFYLFYHDQNENLLNDFVGIPLGQYLLNKIKNYKLEYIDIKLNGNQIKKVTLDRNSTNERLNLLGVTIVDGTSTKENKYRFEYNNFNQLPSLLSKATDHWGFYKGTDFLTPGSTELMNFEDFFASREPNSAYLDIGSLTKITYPTKGFSRFEFEPNYYSKYVNNNLGLNNETSICGGLRIKKIYTNDGMNETMKEIKYVQDLTSNISSGILALKNTYYVPDWHIRTTDNSLYRESVFSLNNLIPFSNFSGSHIGYSKVYEINQDNTGIKSVEYTNYSDYPDIPYTNTISISHSIFDSHINNDFKRGLEKKIEYIDSNTFQVKQTIENTYNEINTKKSRAFNYDQFMPCSNVGDAVSLGNAYEIEYSDFKIVNSKTTDFNSSGNLIFNRDYSYIVYPNSNQFFGNTFLQNEVKLNSDNSQDEVFYNYSFNNTSAIYNAMSSSHFFTVLETFTKRNSLFISKTKENYSYFTINSASKPMISSVEKAKGDNNYETEMYIEKYDNNGKVVQYKNKLGYPYSFIWQNNLLICKMEGALSDEYNYTSFSALNNNINKKATKYTYTPFRNVSTITYPNNYVLKYIYDTDFKLIKITDVNDVILKKFEYNIK